jgi:hypothetical protein
LLTHAKLNKRACRHTRIADFRLNDLRYAFGSYHIRERGKEKRSKEKRSKEKITGARGRELRRLSAEGSGRTRGMR